MNFRERLTGALDSILLTLAMVWTVGIAVALVQPQPGSAPQGTVEVYTLVAAGEPKPGA